MTVKEFLKTYMFMSPFECAPKLKFIAHYDFEPYHEEFEYKIQRYFDVERLIEVNGDHTVSNFSVQKTCNDDVELRIYVDCMQRFKE